MTNGNDSNTVRRWGRRSNGWAGSMQCAEVHFWLNLQFCMAVLNKIYSLRLGMILGEQQQSWEKVIMPCCGVNCTQHLFVYDVQFVDNRKQ